MSEDSLPFDAMLYCKAFFPGSTVTTRFGWDEYTFPGRPRIHPAIDRAGRGTISVPVDAASSQWIRADSQGCSVLRLFFRGGELRMLHFNQAELSNGALAKALVGAPIAKGEKIGPAGNTGLSVSKSGGDGRHLHLSLVLEPGTYDDQLCRVIGDGWNVDRAVSWRDRYGRPFIDECSRRSITWMNQHVIARYDPYYNGRMRYYIDPLIFDL
jgi:hypothetical protein